MSQHPFPYIYASTVDAKVRAARVLGAAGFGWCYTSPSDSPVSVAMWRGSDDYPYLHMCRCDTYRFATKCDIDDSGHPAILLNSPVQMLSYMRLHHHFRPAA